MQESRSSLYAYRAIITITAAMGLVLMRLAGHVFLDLCLNHLPDQNSLAFTAKACGMSTMLNEQASVSIGNIADDGRSHPVSRPKRKKALNVVCLFCKCLQSLRSYVRSALQSLHGMSLAQNLNRVDSII